MSLPRVAGGVAGVGQCGFCFVTARTLSRYSRCPPYGEIRDDTNDECERTAWTSEAELPERVLEQGNMEGAASKPAVPTAARRAMQDWICSGQPFRAGHSESPTENLGSSCGHMGTGW